MKKMFLLLFFILQQASAASIDLNSFLELAQKNDPNFDLIQSNKQKLKYMVDLGLPTRALLVSAKAEYGYSSGNNTNNKTIVNKSNQTEALTAGLAKNIIESGTSLSLQQTQNKRPDRTENVTQFRLEQALYNNMFGRDVRFKKELLELQVKKVKMEILELYEDYILDLSTIYFDFAQAFYNYDLAKKVYKETLVLQSNVRARMIKNIATQTDLNRVQLQVLLAKEDMVAKDNIFRQKITALEKVTGKNFMDEAPKLDVEIPMAPTFKNEIDFTELRAYQVAKYDLEVAEGNSTLQNRASDAKVNLVAGYNIDNSNRFGTTINRHEKVVGLDVQIPIGDTTQKASQLEVALTKNQKILQLKNVELELKKKKADFIEQLHRSHEILSLAKQKVSLAKSILREDQKRYEFGKLDLDNLIQLRKDYSAYRYQYFSALVQYQLVRLGWESFSDTLIQK